MSLILSGINRIETRQSEKSQTLEPTICEPSWYCACNSWVDQVEALTSDSSYSADSVKRCRKQDLMRQI